jgi:Ca2+-binding RTX toxin-like protein
LSRDTVVVSLDSYALSPNLEALEFTFSMRDQRGVGNCRDNAIRTSEGDDRLYGRSGADRLQAAGGADLAFGGAGDDVLEGAAGCDGLHGGRGADALIGGEGADRLFGGCGFDVFLFADVRDSPAKARDVIGAEAGAAAFDGPGRAAGDRIDLSGVDADLTNPPGDPDPFRFGDAGKGGLTVVDVGTDSLVRGNLDDDGGFEFQILIEDGAVKASAYTADDFILALA